MIEKNRKPNIKLIISAEWFNLLIFALKRNAEIIGDGNSRTDATALVEKLMKYSRPYFDDEVDCDCVDMRFFPDEASDMIWQLLLPLGLLYKEPDEDFYGQLKENHIPKSQSKKNNESK